MFFHLNQSTSTQFLFLNTKINTFYISKADSTQLSISSIKFILILPSFPTKVKSSNQSILNYQKIPIKPTTLFYLQKKKFHL